MSIQVNIERNINYNIITTNDLFSINSNSTNYLLRFINKRAFIVIDKNLDKNIINNYFLHNNIEPIFINFISCENNKNFDFVNYLIDECIKYKLKRKEPIIAIGGGILLDIVGFTASIYRRGIPYIKISTSLLSIVDVSVGIKTGINYNNLKNRIGTFYHPLASFNAVNMLTSLSDKHIINGIGEIIKIALVRSNELFDLLYINADELLKTKFQTEIGFKIIQLSIELMNEELNNNYYEDNLERKVDYGHIFSKIFELENNWLHGEAVAIDGFFSVILSYIKGYISLEILSVIYQVMLKLKLPTYTTLTLELLLEALEDSKEHRNGFINLPLLFGSIGNCIIENNINNYELTKALQIFDIINETKNLQGFIYSNNDKNYNFIMNNSNSVIKIISTGNINN